MLTNPLRGVFNEAVEHLSCHRHHRDGSNGATRSAPEQLNRCTQGRVPLLQPRCGARPAAAALGNDQNRYWGHCGGSSAQPQPGTTGWAPGLVPRGSAPLLSPSCCRDPGCCSSDCGNSALRPWGRSETPRAGLCCGYHDAGQDQQLGMGTGKALAPHGALGGSCCFPERGQPW